MHPTPQAHDAEELEYVGFWLRALASLVDTALLLIASLPLWWLLEPKAAPEPAAGTLDFSTLLGIGGLGDILTNYLLPALAVILFWLYKSATPGKMMLGARVVDADSGQALKPGQAVLRYLGYFAAAIPFCVGLIWVGLDPRKQGWHDKLARTVVVRPKRRVEAVSFQPPR
ncbi:RDD family protein [Chromobacterium subtsugae]|uniref:RDD family protein n=1 Tax=Chromobacterium subtsugae TaxID=251747 RepID=A0ABS7FFK9_9NEIS|nr:MULTISPECIES: RDD family protein [Chromobacterium]KUM02352.1 branched-chain amino acid aminotransferase I [Chromobacterium subtsugae]KZE85510.1 branched-chain amino acid aminotransferase I [Chromobacterium sp. F49]MBW7567515.1 RDD family protein [Chromobacterium subtsugae]MBW8288857.1 RDD family protein [Chromobacterium subtsugae]OBU87025.1 branched-chain amino acid aminotransferase I [Chromobacterium subtsugae]